MLRRLIYGVVVYILASVSDVVVVDYDHVTLCQHDQIQASVTAIELSAEDFNLEPWNLKVVPNRGQ